MEIFNTILTKLTLGKMAPRKSVIKKPNLVSDIMENPDNYKLEAFIENEELIVKIKRKEN